MIVLGSGGEASQRVGATPPAHRQLGNFWHRHLSPFPLVRQSCLECRTYLLRKQDVIKNQKLQRSNEVSSETFAYDCSNWRQNGKRLAATLLQRFAGTTYSNMHGLQERNASLRGN